MHGLPSSFLGINPSGWLPHSVSFLNEEKRFFTYAKNEFRLSEVIECNQVVGTLFPILKKYKETTLFVSNFLNEKMKVTFCAPIQSIPRSVFVGFD